MRNHRDHKISRFWINTDGKTNCVAYGALLPSQLLVSYDEMHHRVKSKCCFLFEQVHCFISTKDQESDGFIPFIQLYTDFHSSFVISANQKYP